MHKTRLFKQIYVVQRFWQAYIATSVYAINQFELYELTMYGTTTIEPSMYCIILLSCYYCKFSAEIGRST